MTKPNGNGHKASLDARIAAAIADETATKDELTDLLAEVKQAIEAANETITTETERELDLENVDPDMSADLIAKSKRTIARLTKAAPKLADRIQKLVDAKHAEHWELIYNAREAERDYLANQLTNCYIPFLKQIADIYEKIDALDQEIDELNCTAPSGENRRLVTTELAARGLSSYSADNPPLREHLRLPDPLCTREVLFPQSAPLNQYFASMQGAVAAMAQKYSAPYSDNWFEAKKLEDQQKRVCRFPPRFDPGFPLRTDPV